MQDARIRKEVASLGEAGHLVDIFGPFSRADRENAAISGARSLVTTDMAPRSLVGRLYRLADRLWPLLPHILPAAVLLALFALAAVLGTWLAGPVAAIGTGVVATVAGGLMLRRLGLHRRLHDWLAELRRQRTSARRETHYLTLASQIARAVPADSYDVLHCHDLIPLMAGTDLKRRYPHLRLIWDAHEFYEDTATGTKSDRILARKVISDAAGLVDSFITINGSFRDLYANHYPRLPPARVVMNATPAGPPVCYDGRLHQAAGLAPSRRILLFQGFFHPFRGLETLLKSAQDLPDSWSVVMMGEGPLGDRVRAEAQALAGAVPGSAPLVWLPPAPYPELRLWTAGASLGAIPYEERGLNHLYCTPNKLWEFPNAGVPILATDLCEMGRIIHEYGTGFLLPRQFSHVDVVATLRQITPGDLKKAAANCRSFSDSMSWSRFEPELLKAYLP